MLIVRMRLPSSIVIVRVHANFQWLHYVFGPVVENGDAPP
jgi:hypothetical protein